MKGEGGLGRKWTSNNSIKSVLSKPLCVLTLLISIKGREGADNGKTLEKRKDSRECIHMASLKGGKKNLQKEKRGQRGKVLNRNLRHKRKPIEREGQNAEKKKKKKGFGAGVRTDGNRSNCKGNQQQGARGPKGQTSKGPGQPVLDEALIRKGKCWCAERRKREGRSRGGWRRPSI